MPNFTIDVNLNIAGLPEAFRNLADVLIAYAAEAFERERTTDRKTNTGSGAVDHAETATPTETAIPAEASAPVNTVPEADTAPPSPPDPVPETPAVQARTYTLDELSRAGAALIDQGKMAQLLALLKKYNVQALTQLDPSVYASVADELITLGAKL